MKKIHRFLSRYRLITSILALAVLMGALAVTPAEADGPQCEPGCIDWIKGIGCIDCQFCCVWPDGSYSCIHDYDDTWCGGTGGIN